MEKKTQLNRFFIKLPNKGNFFNKKTLKQLIFVNYLNLFYIKIN
jgi:hypothetical protein